MFDTIPCTTEVIPVRVTHRSSQTAAINCGGIMKSSGKRMLLIMIPVEEGAGGVDWYDEWYDEPPKREHDTEDDLVWPSGGPVNVTDPLPVPLPDGSVPLPAPAPAPVPDGGAPLPAPAPAPAPDGGAPLPVPVKTKAKRRVSRPVHTPDLPLGWRHTALQDPTACTRTVTEGGTETLYCYGTDTHKCQHMCIKTDRHASFATTVEEMCLNERAKYKARCVHKRAPGHHMCTSCRKKAQANASRTTRKPSVGSGTPPAIAITVASVADPDGGILPPVPGPQHDDPEGEGEGGEDDDLDSGLEAEFDKKDTLYLKRVPSLTQQQERLIVENEMKLASGAPPLQADECSDYSEEVFDQ